MGDIVYEYIDLVKQVHIIVNNPNFKIFCNPNSLTYGISIADVERVILAYGLLLNEAKTNED